MAFPVSNEASGPRCPEPFQLSSFFWLCCSVHASVGDTLTLQMLCWVLASIPCMCIPPLSEILTFPGLKDKARSHSYIPPQHLTSWAKQEPKKSVLLDWMRTFPNKYAQAIWDVRMCLCVFTKPNTPMCMVKPNVLGWECVVLPNEVKEYPIPSVCPIWDGWESQIPERRMFLQGFT